MKTTLVVREPNHQLPEAFRKALLDGHHTAIGYASPQKDQEVHSDVYASVEYELPTALSEIEKSYQSERVFYYAVEGNDDELNLDSLQPFAAITNGKEGEEKKVLLSVIMAGKFPSYEDQNEDGESYTPEYHCFSTFIKATIDELWELANGDIGLLMTFLEKKPTRDKINAVLGDDACIMMIPYKGKATSFNKGHPKSGTFKGGFTTDLLGYEEPKEAEKKVEEKKEPPKKLSMAEQIAAKKAGGTAKKDPPAGGSPIKPEETFATVLKNPLFYLNGGKLWARPPRGSNWKEARQWWNNSCKLQRPQEVDKVYVGFPADELKVNSPLYAVYNKLMQGEEAKPVPKEAEHEQAPKEAPITKDPVAKGITLLLPGDKKQKFLQMKKDGKIKMGTEADFKAAMDEYPFLSAQLGENFSDMQRYSIETKLRLAHDLGGHYSLLLAHENTCRSLGLNEAEVVEPEKKPEEKPQEETQPSVPTVKKLSMAEQIAAKRAKAA